MTNHLPPKLISWITAISFFLLPLIASGQVLNSFHSPKMLLLVSTAALLLILVTAHIIRSKKMELTWHPTFIPIILLLASYLISSFLQSPNLSEAWYERTFIVAALTLIYIVGVSYNDNTLNRKLRIAFLSSAVILAVFSIAHVTGITEIIPFVNQNNPLWNLTGSPVSLILWLASALAISFTTGIFHPSFLKKSTYFTLALVQGVALAVIISDIILNEETAIINLPHRVGYTIAIDNLKNPQSALFGMGPDNYLAAFSFFKPAFFNTRYPDLWNIRFSTSSNELFHVFTINGLLGATAFVLLLIWIIKRAINQFTAGKQGIAIAAGVLVLGLLLFPANATTLGLLFLILMLQFTHQQPYKITVNSQPTTIFIGIILVVLAISGFWFGSRFTAADYYMNQAVRATAANQPQEAINNSLQAIRLNPNRISYRIFYSDLNLRIAEALARQDQLTEEQQQDIIRAIQFAVNQAQVGAQLNVQNVTVWEHQARLYSKLINLARGADQSTLNAYRNAITLDPRNPRLRVEYGQFLQTVGQLEAATQLYREAANLKPDYANAYFNLASAFEAQNRIADAYVAVQRTVQFLDPGSSDYVNATQKLAELEQRVQDIANQQGQTNTEDQQPDNTGGDQDLTQPEGAPQAPQNLAPVDVEQAPDQIQPDDTLLPISPTPTPDETQAEETTTDQASPSPTPSPSPNN